MQRWCPYFSTLPSLLRWALLSFLQFLLGSLYEVSRPICSPSLELIANDQPGVGNLEERLEMVKFGGRYTHALDRSSAECEEPNFTDQVT